MARLNRLVISGEGDVRLDAAFAFGLRLGEAVKQRRGVGDLEIIGRKLDLILMKHVAIGDAAIVKRQVVNTIDALDIHGEPFQPVGQLTCHRLAIKTAHLLEIGELRHFHAVAPDFPAKAPCAERRAIPSHPRQSGCHVSAGQCRWRRANPDTVPADLQGWAS